MTTLVDFQIADLCSPRNNPLISPFSHSEVNHKGTTYGLSSASYNVRISNEVLIQFGNIGVTNIQNVDFTKIVRDDFFIIHPQQFLLATTIEYLIMPSNISASVKDKSTWARMGIAVQNTFIDPGFRGQVTLEITNHSLNKIQIPIGVGICQLVFNMHDHCVKPYKGKYQGQIGVTKPKARRDD